MKTICAYQCADGKIKLNEKEAIAHEDDLIGAEIDAFCSLLQSNTLTRHDMFRAAIRMIGPDRAKLLAICKNIVRLIEYTDIGEL